MAFTALILLFALKIQTSVSVLNLNLFVIFLKIACGNLITVDIESGHQDMRPSASEAAKLALENPCRSASDKLENLTRPPAALY